MSNDTEQVGGQITTGLSEDIYVYSSHLFHLLCDMGFAVGMSNVVVGCGYVTVVAELDSWETTYQHIIDRLDAAQRNWL